jgi:hypothetical protein
MDFQVHTELPMVAIGKRLLAVRPVKPAWHSAVVLLREIQQTISTN